VVDTQKGVAYLGEESTGVWTLDVNQTQASPQLAITIAAPVESDVEGLSLFDVDGVRYLIASSQGNNQYAVYSTDHTFSLIGMVEVAANREKSIDGASETDGLATSNYNFGGEFSEGIFVVQDGRNIMPSERQNFKIVTGASLANAIRSLNAAN
jgi:3-phytase